MVQRYKYLAVLAMASTSSVAWAAPNDMDALRAELAAAKERIAAQQQQLETQEQRLQRLESRLGSPQAASAPPSAVPVNPATGAGTRPAPAITAAQGSAASTPGDPASVQQAPLEKVGEAPAGSDRPPEVAVLGSEGSVVTRKGQLTAEFGAEYARNDRNQALFRGIGLIETILVGVFNISESRQDLLTLAGSLRYGVTNKLELGVRAPFVHRANNLVSIPIGQTNETKQESSAQGTGLGDLELSARYQLATAQGGWPYLVGNLQVVTPTGSNPFSVPRRVGGEEIKSATGAGFWGVSPSITAILPTDPAVLFGTVGFTKNFGRSFGTRIGSAIIDRVEPGNALSFSAGIGISLNQRTSINLGYAHSWAFGTKTITRLIVDDVLRNPTEQTSRNLQVGRFLFGMTYKVHDRASVNWSVEVGATEDATNMRSVLRIPMVLLTGG